MSAWTCPRPVMVLSPRDGMTRAHGTNERIPADALPEAIRFYRRLIEVHSGGQGGEPARAPQPAAVPDGASRPLGA